LNVREVCTLLSSHITMRIRHAGPMASDCQLRREPGVACSRLVEPSRCAAGLAAA
jgi:hypothetical protein